MTTPFRSSSAQAPGVNAVSAVSALQDVLSRSGGEAQSSGGGTPDFSRMVAQYRDAPASTAPQASRPVAKAAAQASDPASRALTQRLTEQALSKARMAQQSKASVAPKPVASGAKEAQAPRPPSRTEEARKTPEPEKPSVDEAEDAASRKTAFATSQGEGVAFVRELTPPPGIEAGDAAGMMNWLAQLTQGELAPDAGAESLAAGGASEAGAAVDLLPSGQPAEAGGVPGWADALGAARGQTATAALQGVVTGEALELGLEASADQQIAALGDARTADATLAAARPGAFGALLGEAAGARHASASLTPSPGTPQFTQALNDQVNVWVGTARTGGPMTAELHLNPADMGPINVKIAVDGQVARVDFAATTLETRQAIEAGLQQLARALDEVGLSLTGGQVMSQFAGNGQARGQADGQPGAQQTASGGAGDGALPGEPGDSAAPRQGRVGLSGLDLYA